ncbi:olfactory receptor 51H1-like [Archocentrus centrarchus]|uniref:olfactory receptor 51H1-like n=1 Tax=Archocentrus centrarchus TaxID=63155 RepID=UPI0011EA22A3|nr:olfactory receptor 51H1-like [Archocentrus centrarchus]
MGSEDKAATMFNTTFVRPEKFYLSGFSNIPHITYYYVFLCFVYIMTVLGNGFLLSVISLVKTLHTYMIVFNMALTDLCASTALIPKLLDTFLFDRRYIVYEACLSYMFFVLFFASVQSWTLVTMAYDRLIAICFPLRYHSFVTETSITAILIFVWIFLVSVIATMVGLLNRLSFCSSLVVNSLFCEHGPVYRLACNDTSLNYKFSVSLVVIIVIIPLLFVVVTYVCIFIALSRTTSREERLRALKTCISHLILVAIFFLPFVGTSITVWTSYIHANVRMINSTLTHTIPSLLNPIIYALKTEEVINAIKKLCKRNLLSIMRPQTKFNSKRVGGGAPEGGTKTRNKEHREPGQKQKAVAQGWEKHARTTKQFKEFGFTMSYDNETDQEAGWVASDEDRSPLEAGRVASSEDRAILGFGHMAGNGNSRETW